MPWLEPTCPERNQLRDALAFGDVQWAEIAEEFVDRNLDADLYSVETLREMALAQVSDPKRKVHFVDDDDAAIAAQRFQGLGKRWYAVELRCDGKVVFFKIKFLRDSTRNTMVIRCHWQIEADIWEY